MNKHIPTLTHVIYLMLMYVPAESAATTIDINPKCWESCVGVDALLQQWSDKTGEQNAAVEHKLGLDAAES